MKTVEKLKEVKIEEIISGNDRYGSSGQTIYTGIVSGKMERMPE